MWTRNLSSAFLVVFWLCAMTWLVTTKIVPSYRVPPQLGYSDVLNEDQRADMYARWRVVWNGRPIGEADYEVLHHSDGGATIHSRVDFQQLPVADLMESLAGMMVKMLPAELRGELNLSLDATIDTTVHFDAYNRLVDLSATAGLADSSPLVAIRGTNSNGALQLQCRVVDDTAANGVSYVTEVPMANEGFHIDALTPMPRLRRLHVGQTWYQRTLRPLSASAGWETTRAEVVARESILWNNERHEAYRVTFETSSAAALSVAQRQLGEMWVLRDGRVVRQRTRWGAVNFEFERLP